MYPLPPTTIHCRATHTGQGFQVGPTCATVMGAREQRKRKVSSRLKAVDASSVADARNTTWLDSLENDNHQAEQEAQLLQHDDDDYEYAGGITIDDSDDELQHIQQQRKKKKKRTTSAAIYDASAAVTPAASARDTVNIEKWNMSLPKMLLEDHPRPPRLVSYDQLLAAPSKKPKRNFCAVCGDHAPYTCPKCTARFCCLRCSDVHEQTQCLKMIAG